MRAIFRSPSLSLSALWSERGKRSHSLTVTDMMTKHPCTIRNSSKRLSQPTMLHYIWTKIDCISPECDSICFACQWQWHKERIQTTELYSKQRVWFCLFPFRCTFIGRCCNAFHHWKRERRKERRIKKNGYIFFPINWNHWIPLEYGNLHFMCCTTTLRIRSFLLVWLMLCHFQYIFVELKKICDFFFVKLATEFFCILFHGWCWTEAIEVRVRLNMKYFNAFRFG